jgi:hypothetical protein
VKRNTALAPLWPLALVVLTAMILAAGLLALVGMLALGAGRRRRPQTPEPHRTRLGSVAHLPVPPAEGVLTPPTEATLGRAA